jgi:hypothetical protein
MALTTCRREVLFLFLAPVFTAATFLAGPVRAADLTVFAAASLKNALDDAVKRYETKTGRKVVVSYAASSALAKQIEAGAPADIFFSADLDWMDALQKKNLIDVASRRTLLGNTLVLIAPKASTVSLPLEKDLPLLGARRSKPAGERRLRARGPVRQGGADVSRCVGCCRTTRGTGRQCPRGAGLRGKR